MGIILPFIILREGQASPFLDEFNHEGFSYYKINKDDNNRGSGTITLKGGLLCLEPSSMSDSLSIVRVQNRMLAGEVVSLAIHKESALDLSLTLSTVNDSRIWTKKNIGIKYCFNSTGFLEFKKFSNSSNVKRRPFKKIKDLKNKSFVIHVFRDTKSTFSYGYSLGKDTDIIILGSITLNEVARNRALYVGVQAEGLGKVMIESLQIKRIPVVSVKPNEPNVTTVKPAEPTVKSTGANVTPTESVAKKTVNPSPLRTGAKTSIVRGSSSAATLEKLSSVKWCEAGIFSDKNSSNHNQYLVVSFTLDSGYSISTGDYSFESNGKRYTCQSITSAKSFGPKFNLLTADTSEKQVQMLFEVPQSVNSGELIFNYPTTAAIPSVKLILK